MLLALMVTPEGVPVGYEVLPGATFEGHSLPVALERLRTLHDLRHVICVADRGMMSAENIRALEEAGMHYIVAAKLKSLSGAMKQEVLDIGRFGEPAADGVRIREILSGEQRIVVSYSPRRADKDRHDRAKALERLHKRLARSKKPKGLIGNRGHARFLRVEGDADVVIDEQRVKAHARWDGLHGVVTNLPPDTPAAEVVAHYAGLWQVDDTFRVTKHDLKIRPIFHWTPRRVRAHIAIAFMALVCVRHLAYRTRIQQQSLSAEVIRRTLVRVQCSVLGDQRTGRRYVIPSSMSSIARKLYAVMGLARSVKPFELTKPGRPHRV